MSVKHKKVILGVTGSIAAYKSVEILRYFQENNVDVSVVMTKEAEYFITPLTLSSLAGKKIHQWGFNEGDDAWQMNHIKLAEEADALLVAPATANIIGKFAAGLADDLLTCIFLSIKSKIYIAPAMNENMYKNKIVVENCQRLRKFGIQFIEPIKGKLACGLTGEGHIAEPKDIADTVINGISRR